MISFVVTKESLAYVKGLTVSLQRRANDICCAYQEVNSVLSALTEIRGQIDSTHKKWYDNAVNLGQQVRASEPELPRRCGIQTARSNMPGDTPEVYYKWTISIPFLDGLVSHLESRFSNFQKRAIMGMEFVPSVMVDKSIISANTTADVMEQYGEDIPNPSGRETEIHLWRCKWNSVSHEVPDTPAAALNFASHTMFPNTVFP